MRQCAVYFQFPLKVTLKIIAMIKRQAFFMLKSSYHNSWSNPYFLSKFLNTHRGTIRIMRYKSLPLDRINQYICSECIRFLLGFFSNFLVYF